MKKIFPTILCLTLLGGCCLQRRARTNSQNIATLYRSQQEVFKLLEELKRTKAEKRMAQQNRAALLKLWARLMRNPVLTMKDVKYREQVDAYIKELANSNIALGIHMLGDGYMLILGQYFHIAKKDQKLGLQYYNLGIKHVRSRIKTGKQDCGVIGGGMLTSCKGWLIGMLTLTYYNRACIHSLQGKKALAKADLMWLDTTGNMKAFALHKDMFWADPDFRSLGNERWYKSLVCASGRPDGRSTNSNSTPHDRKVIHDSLTVRKDKKGGFP